MSTWFYNWVWVQQDYLWFLAGLGWLVVGIQWWQGRKQNELPGWAIWSAGAGVVIAIVEIVMLVTPGRFEPGMPPSLPSDFTVGLVFAVQTAGWWIAGLRGQRGRLVLVPLISAILLFAAIWRYERPIEGTTIIMSVLVGGMAWWLVVCGKAGQTWRIALVVATLAPLLSPIGPLAILVGQQQRWVEENQVGPWSALVQALAATWLLFEHRRRRLATNPHAERDRAERWFPIGVAGWLAFGFAFAIVAGERGRIDFERSALGRVRATAALMPVEHTAALLSDQLRVENVRWVTFPDGDRLAIAHSPHAEIHAESVVNDLRVIASANPDVRWTSIVTLRDGWLIAPALAELPRKRFGDMALFRRVTDEDDSDWAEQRASVSRPVTMTGNEMVFARAPLVSPSGRMLGWLNFMFSVTQWVAAQAQPRSLTYLIIALGLVVGRQLVIQRHRVRERDRAHAEATAANEASNLKTTFLANVSHELRTPLQTIMGNTELLLSHATPKDGDRLRAIREHADLMGRLVNDLIDLSAAESGNFRLIERPVALVDQIVEAVESLRAKAEAKGVTFSVQASSDIPPWLQTDPQRVRQVVLNLVGNAVKYTDRGHVDVSLSLVGRQISMVDLEFRVTDTGPGITPAHQKQLFAAFQRLDLTADREGTGLGLAIVAAVCRALGGSVRVESDGRTGSCFVARWRLAIAAGPAPTAGSSVPLRGRRILVADDNALVRDLFVSFLTECGAVCATATDGVEAVRRLRNEPFEAVVLDLAMPRLDGVSAVRQLRRDRPDGRWRIVGVSAHASGLEREEALAAGMDAFLVKPVALPELARALAPEIDWIPPVQPFDRMRAHFEQRFRAEAAAQGESVDRAWQRGEWKEIQGAAHYLKNSADVVGDEGLSAACAALEAAARARDHATGAEAWRSCRIALARWVTTPAAN
jgi:signal transduction histidine kinase/ActR/RegA family two-component response regulator